jgi:hypothetical protein
MTVVFRILLVASALFAVDFVFAWSVSAKDEPKYVGDFPDHTKRQNIQIIDDGPNTGPYRQAPIVVVPAGPEARPPMPEAQKQLSRIGKHYPVDTKSAKTETPTAVKVNRSCDFEPPAVNFPPDLLPGTAARLQVPEPQSRMSRLGEQYDAARARSERERTRLTPGGAIGDFPLPKLNFPREIGPAGKFAIPMTASPGLMNVPAKPMRAGGAAQKGDASRLRKPTNLRVNASPIQTYPGGYVPGSTSSEDKSKGVK